MISQPAIASSINSPCWYYRHIKLAIFTLQVFGIQGVVNRLHER
ncbi:hypothetical protein [Nostoc sp. DSM 114161]